MESKVEDNSVLMLGVNKAASQPWDGKRTYRTQFDTKGDCYGTPVPGSYTAVRAQLAAKHINQDVTALLQIIQTIGCVDASGKITVTFAKLFHHYERVSNKVVGILLRARRWGLVQFPGEMLFQGRDDNVMIVLVTEQQLPVKANSVDLAVNAL